MAFFSIALVGSLLSAAAAAGVTCSTNFTAISATAWATASNPGWNLGNTLDAIPTEGSWNNPPVQFETFDDIKASGFKSVRLPVTWINHFTTESPTWTVDPTWMQRVSDVVDAVIQRDMYALVNVHHDATDWADLTASGANYTMIEEKFYQLWYQIGTKLACKSSLLAFEPINEPPGSTTEQYDELNKLQGLFIKALADSGGFNAKRVVTLIGPSENADLTDQYFAPPPNMTNPYAIQYHYYSPYDFIFGAWGKSIWGSDADKQSMDTDLSIVPGNFTDTPIIIGEWSATTTYTETAARWKYFDYFARIAAKYSTTTMLWDNGLDHFDRQARVWRDPTELDILMNATAGTPNSLADSTEDLNALSQETSAYIFLNSSTNATDISLPYLFNGNTLQSITSADGPFKEGTDYILDESNITYTSSFLSQYTCPTCVPGLQANLTLTFSAGSSLHVPVITYSTPTLSSTSSAASAVPSGSDLRIPITWAGLEQLAAVKATLADGTFLVDSWTQYLGPLQQGRMTYNSQYNWDSQSVVLTSAAVQAVRAAGQDTVFEFEFYPRGAGNTVSYTLTV